MAAPVLRRTIYQLNSCTPNTPRPQDLIHEWRVTIPQGFQIFLALLRRVVPTTARTWPRYWWLLQLLAANSLPSTITSFLGQQTHIRLGRANAWSSIQVLVSTKYCKSVGMSTVREGSGHASGRWFPSRAGADRLTRCIIRSCEQALNRDQQ